MMPQPRRRRITVIVMTALVLGAVAAIGVAVFAFIGVANGPDLGAGSSSTAAATSSAPSTTPSTDAPMAAAMREWESRAGEHFKESAQALGQISQAADSGDDAAVRAACQRLHDTNSVGLQADLPTPDPELTSELQRMIDDMNTATHACLRFVDSMTPVDASIYQDYLSRAMDHLHQAKVILDADLGKG